MKDGIRMILAILVFIVGVIFAVYFGLWVMFIKPIMAACAAFDAGTLTAVIIGETVLKCIFASAAASVILAVFTGIAQIIAED